MPRIYSRTFEVPADAIDENGHVGNLEYLRWMQDIAIEHSAAQGWTRERYFRERASWVVRSHFIEYLRPAFRGDLLSLHTWVRAINGSRSPRRYLVTRESDGGVIARAETLWVYVAHRTGRVQPIPDALRAALPLVPTDEEAMVEIGIAGEG